MTCPIGVNDDNAIRLDLLWGEEGVVLAGFAEG